MKIRYTPQARQDLWQIETYISAELCNPSAANHIVSGILKSCSKLKEQPAMGISLAKKTGNDTELMYIITGKYLVFYKMNENGISIIRILDSRTDYMRIILEAEV